MDATGTILPLAYVVVDSENDASWKWFFEQFKHAYGERPNIWSRVHAIVNQTWTMTSNIVESLNAGTLTYLEFKFNKELDDNRTLSYKLRVRASTDYIHTVLNGVRRYIICLENKRCSPYYTRESLLRTYEIPVNHLPDENKCNVPQHITEEVVNPPLGGKRQSGRPQK
ncbi:uncharacterized protein [Nicotiana sylvestris]|uniref:uncharacterized protein n=1 Tax=Nicotiana sylvestris TaxID=4096 RepID=UPI00388C3E8D